MRGCALAAGGRLLCRFVTGGRVPIKPDLSGRGTIYVVSEDRHLYALAADGSQRCRLHLGRRPSASPTAEGSPCLAPALGRDGSIYLPVRAEVLFCLDYHGRLAWRYRTRSELTGS